MARASSSMSPSSSVEDDIASTSFWYGRFIGPAAQCPRLAQLFEGTCPGRTDAAPWNPQAGTDLVVGQGWVGEQQEQQLSALLRKVQHRLAQGLRPEVLDQRRTRVDDLGSVEGGAGRIDGKVSGSALDQPQPLMAGGRG